MVVYYCHVLLVMLWLVGFVFLELLAIAQDLLYVHVYHTTHICINVYVYIFINKYVNVPCMSVYLYIFICLYLLYIVSYPGFTL